MTTDEYLEMLSPTPIQLYLEDIEIGESFYFDHPEFTKDRAFKVSAKNGDRVTISYIHDISHYVGTYDGGITVKRVK